MQEYERFQTIRYLVLLNFFPDYCNDQKLFFHFKFISTHKRILDQYVNPKQGNPDESKIRWLRRFENS